MGDILTLVQESFDDCIFTYYLRMATA